jgi:hypothetical protein
MVFNLIQVMIFTTSTAPTKVMHTATRPGISFTMPPTATTITIPISLRAAMLGTTLRLQLHLRPVGVELEDMSLSPPLWGARGWLLKVRYNRNNMSSHHNLMPRSALNDSIPHHFNNGSGSVYVPARSTPPREQRSSECAAA